MIERLHGKVLKRSDGHVILEVGGVGFGVDVPYSADILPVVGEELELFTYLYVQEAILRLYGFLSEGEKDIFEVFIGTSGIGPKTALGILSSIEIDAFVAAVLQRDVYTLTRLPGIGKKTAERLIVELGDKVKHLAGVQTKPQAAPGAAGRAAALEDTAAALQSLGTKPAVAVRAAQKALEALGPKATVEELVKEALKHRY